jgi:alpha-glucosidase
MEFSHSNKFIDARSYFAWHRHVKPPHFLLRRKAGTLTIKTARMELFWRGGNAGFTASNLSIRFLNGKNVWKVWTPGSRQTRNLGGTLGSLDGCNGPKPLPDGVLSRNGWYLFRDNTVLVTDGAHPWIQPRPASEISDWYFFGYGKGHYQAALRDLTTISGRIPIPPRYMLGAWRSRYHSFTADQFRQLALEYNAHKIPLDVMVMDMGWHTTPHWGSYNWNRKLIPHPRKLLAWLHGQGLHVTLNLHPQSGVGPWDSQFKEFCHRMGLNPAVTKRASFEPFSQKSMHYYFKLLLDPLEKQGVNFWWLDWGDQYLGWVNALDFWNIGRPSTGNRGASFSRWGGWGDQRYPISCSGDTRSRWRVLRFEVPFVATAGNVGADYWSNDIGGFAVFIPSAQLYTRWIQFGALSPVFRTHNEGSYGDHRVPWYYGHRAEAAARVGYDLRSRLLPYIYTCAYQCWEQSLPLIRPLYLGYPSARQAYHHPEEYQFGSDLLVSPVVGRGIGKAWLGSVDMWFPSGKWWNPLTGESVDHSGDRPVLASGNEIPLFIRGGIPIPMQRLSLRMAEKPANPLVVCVYPGPSGQFDLYEDDGASPAYLHGKYALTSLQYQNLGRKGVRVVVGPTLGSYAGQPQSRSLIIHLPVTTVPDGVSVNGKPVSRSAVAVPGYSYNPVTVTTTIRLPVSSIRKAVEVRAEFSGSNAIQSLLPKVLNRLAMVHRALAGAGQFRAGWKFKLDRVLFHLQVLRSVAAQEFGVAGPVDVRTGLRAADNDMEQIQASLSQHRSQQSQAAACALSNCFLSAAVKLRDATKGVLEKNVRRYYRSYSGVNNVKKYRVGLMLHSLIPAAAGQRNINVDVPGLVQRQFVLPKGKVSAFVFTPILAATEHPLYNFCGKATLAAGLGHTQIAISRSIRMQRELLDRWAVVGPFPLDKAPSLGGIRITPVVLSSSYKGKGNKTVAWESAAQAVRHVTQYGRKRWINVHRLYPQNNASAIAVTWIKAPVPLTCQIDVRHDDGIKLWVHERRIIKTIGSHAMSDPPAVARVHLHAGWNQFVVQADQLKWAWGFSIRLRIPQGIVLSQSAQPPEPGSVTGAIVAPPASSPHSPINLGKAAADWAYFDYFAGNRSIFEHKMLGPNSVTRAQLGGGQQANTSTDSQDYISFSDGTPVKSQRSLRSFAYTAGNGRGIEFKHILLAKHEVVTVYLTSFDAKVDLSAQLGTKVLFRKRAVVLGDYYDPQKDGDGTGSGHGYAVLKLDVHGAVGDALTVRASVDLTGVKHRQYASVGIQAAAVVAKGGRKHDKH